MSSIDFMRFPGEIRNTIYDMVIRELPELTYGTVNTSLPAIAFASKLIHREFASRYLPQAHVKLISIYEIWRISTLIDIHSQGGFWHKMTRLTIANFTAISRTRARANEVMDLICHFDGLQNLVLDMTLGDLHYGLWGRIKDIGQIFADFELFRLFTLRNLSTLTLDIKPEGLLPTSNCVALLHEMAGELRSRIACVHIFLQREWV
jgi:hypothetical protein